MNRKSIVLVCTAGIVGLANGNALADQGAPALTKNRFGVETREGPRSDEGRAEGSSGTAGHAPTARELPGSDGTSGAGLTTCNWWWIWGSHNWRWRGIPGLYVSYKFNARSDTFYGGATNPDECGRPPLVVDQLHVSGQTYTSGVVLRINKTQYNVSSVSDSQSGWGVGSLAAKVCGAISYHEARKSGVTWYYTVRSGSTSC